MIKRLVATTCLLAVLTLSCALAGATAYAADEQQTFAVDTSDALKKQGITASSATTPKGMDPVLPEITVLLNFSAPVSELIFLSALNEKGEVLYHSKTVRMTAKKAGAHPVTFAFPEGAVFKHVTAVKVFGPADMEGMPKKEGVLDEAKDIIEELFE